MTLPALTNLVRRLYPRTLGTRIIVLTIAGIMVSHAILITVLVDDRRTTVWATVVDAGLKRLAVVARTLSALEEEERDRVIPMISHRRQRIRMGPLPPFLAEAGGADAPLTQRARMHMEAAGLSVTSLTVRRARDLSRPPNSTFRDVQSSETAQSSPPSETGRPDRRSQLRPRSNRAVITEAVFVDGMRLHSVHHLPTRQPFISRYLLIATGLTALVLSLIMIVIVRHVTKPLAALAGATAAFGRGGPAKPLPEEGPEEVRRTIAAFNQMGARIEDMLAHQRHMIGAIGHDLRTPITALRLRAETVTDEETRTRMIRTLDEMQTMTEGVLDLVRQDHRGEPMRPTDLSALVQSLADDLTDLGGTVTVTTPERFVHDCRPAAMIRCLRNLAENALRYAGPVDIVLERAPDGSARFQVLDRGPGIPEEKLSMVFEPFTRLEGSRNAETGGIGLGLTIARMLIEAQGGTIQLANRPGGGLVCELTLPPA